MSIPRTRWRTAALALLIALLTIGLFALAWRAETFLLFHSLVELASIVVAVAIFSIGWSTRRIAGHSFLLVLAVAMLFVGLIDLLHTLSFKGMQVFPWDDANLPTQFWVAARYLESLSFVAAALVLVRKRTVTGGSLLLVYTVVTTALVVSIVPLRIFPDSLLDPGGLTPFKIYSEFVVIVLLAWAGGLIWQQRAILDSRVASLLLLTLALKISSEIFFTLYGTEVAGPLNVMGHILKAFATATLYLALVQASVTAPFQTLFRGLHASQEWMRVTLTSIGDAVIACDTGGYITFVNTVAERLCGWPADEAIGQPLQRVFNVIDEQTGETGEDIIGRVLRDGTIVEEIDHSTLITRDQTHRPIEESAAPIRKEDGSVSGVVLVFRDVTAKRLAEAALQAHAQRMQLLSATTAQLLETDDPQSMIEELARKVMQVLDCHAFINFLVDQQAGLLRLHACTGILPEDAASIEVLDYGVSVSGNVAVERRPMIAEFVQQSADERVKLKQKFGFRAYACHPLLSTGGKLLGTLAFGTRTRDQFSVEDLTLMRTVTDHIAIAIERMQSAREREAVLQQMNTFIHMISHDLRVPLSVVHGHADHLADLPSLADDIQLVTSVQAITRNVKRIDVMIEDLVEVARVEGGQLQLTLQPLSLPQYLKDLLMQYNRVLCLERIHLQVHDACAPVMADEDRLARIIINLLTNAQKYSEPDTPITITVRQQDKSLVVAVTDQGYGVHPDDIPELFNRFFRARGVRKADGIGLGLYITKRLVEALGGRIWVESELDLGSTFAFTLPCVPAQSACVNVHKFQE